MKYKVRLEVIVCHVYYSKRDILRLLEDQDSLSH